MKVVSIVGMAGAGKSEVARLFTKNNFTKIRFGDILTKPGTGLSNQDSMMQKIFLKDLDWLKKQENGVI